MTLFNVTTAMNVRAYGSIQIEADNEDDLRAKLQALTVDSVQRDFIIKKDFDVWSDSPDVAFLDAESEDGEIEIDVLEIELSNNVYLTIQDRKVIVSREGVNAFRQQWPGCSLRDRSYWFEFDADGDLIDTDVPEHDDGPGSSAMADDCLDYLQYGSLPAWAE